MKTYTTMSGRVLELTPTEEEAIFLARVRAATADPGVTSDELLRLIYSDQNPVLDPGLFPGPRGAVTRKTIENPVYRVMTDLIDHKRVQEGEDFSRVHERFSMTVSNAAAQLGVTTSAVRQAIRDQRLAAWKVRGKWMLDPDGVEAYEVGRQGPGHKLEILTGHQKGLVFKIKHDGCFTKQEADSEQPERSALGILSEWTTLWILTGMGKDGGRIKHRLFKIERGDDVDELVLDPFYARGRFQVVERINNPKKAEAAWKDL